MAIRIQPQTTSSLPKVALVIGIAVVIILVIVGGFWFFKLPPFAVSPTPTPSPIHAAGGTDVEAFFNKGSFRELRVFSEIPIESATTGKDNPFSFSAP